MPIYEYKCQGCSAKSSQFIRSVSQNKEHECPHCGSGDVKRLISKVAVIRPFMESLNNLPSFETLSDFDENDPKSVIDWTKRIRGEMGAEFGTSPSDINTMLDAGVTPSEFLSSDD